MDPSTSSLVTDSEENSCFDKFGSRGIKTSNLIEEGKDTKYICYSANVRNQDSFHSSYQTLLNILADRIEMKAMDIQVKVKELENALFFKQKLRFGML